MLMTSHHRQMRRLHGVFDYHTTALPHRTDEHRGDQIAAGDPLQAFGPDLAARLKPLRLPEPAIHILAAAPIAFAAWASWQLAPGRRRMALPVIQREGRGMRLAECPLCPVWQTLALWLERRPDDHLLQVWEDYIGALSWVLRRETLQALEQTTRRRCRAVLSATSGCVAGPRFLAGEHPILRRIGGAFAVCRAGDLVRMGSPNTEKSR